MKQLKESIENLKKRLKSVKESKYSILIYIWTILIVSIWTIFTPCISYLALPIIAIYIPTKLYGEDRLKRLAIAGLLGVLLVSSTATLYHTNLFYSQEMTTLESPNSLLEEGRVDRIYEDTQSPFNFTVTVDEEVPQDNFTVQLNISYELWSADGSEIIEDSYNMTQMNDGVYFKEIELDERKYFHKFSVNYTENGKVTWEETDQAFGPMTLPFEHTLVSIFIQRTPVPLLVFLFILSILWWREKLEESREKSTKGLMEKEKQLEDYCPNCGELLDGAEECPECGYVKNRVKNDNRITCGNCGQNISKDQETCPYCGEDVDV
ncbi:MAG: zinc ribbon domain-containing protein [Candidatus Saliniplasma sp.]